MSTIYLASDYGKLNKNGETLRLNHSDGSISIIQPYKTEQLVIIGNVEITSGALKLLMHKKIDVIFLNKNGRFEGKLQFQEGKNVYLRFKQYKLLEDENFKLGHCKSIVSGKLKNQYSYMQRIRREREVDKNFNKTIENMRVNIQKVESAESIDQIRGYEGIGSKYFFSIFKYNIIPEWAVFNGRSRNPPEDTVNAVLSFLYTLLSYKVESAIESEGLDCYVGYLHTLNYGRKSLIFDLMEEYRTPIADMLTASIFNLNILTEDDFEVVNFSKTDDEHPLIENTEEINESAIIDNKKGVLIKKPVLNKVITQFEKKLESNHFYQPDGKSVSFKYIIREQVKHFKRVLNGEENEYKPLIIK